MRKIALLFVLATITMVAIGQTNEEVTQMLSNPEARTLVMDQISNDVTMSKEMTSRIMESCKTDTAMRHNMMSKMMDACKADTTMRNCMMAEMMEACKSDSTMMKSMNRHMMGKPKMKDAMEQKRTESQKSKAVEGLDKTTLTVTRKKQ